jgi:hypothetical protein
MRMPPQARAAQVEPLPAAPPDVAPPDVANRRTRARLDYSDMNAHGMGTRVMPACAYLPALAEFVRGFPDSAAALANRCWFRGVPADLQVSTRTRVRTPAPRARSRVL